MVKRINPCRQFYGEVVIPASKSVSQRVLALVALVEGKLVVKGIGNSDDELAALAIIQQLGAKVKQEENEVFIDATQVDINQSLVINVNESGLSTRMFIPIVANSSKSVKIVGKGSILKRPMHFFEEVLPLLGVRVSSSNSCLPFHVQGPLSPNSIEVDGSLSSQYITGLLYGFIASKKTGDFNIRLKNLKSKPYLLLSLSVLQMFGVNVEYENECLLYKGPYKLNADKISVEGDWSSASFLLVGAAIRGEVVLSNLNKDSDQADRELLRALEDFGAKVRWEEDKLRVSKSEFKHFVFDAVDCPDLFPPLAVLAVFGSQPSIIKGIHRLYYKESNRALAIQEEFSKLGVRVVLNKEEDTMVIHPSKVVGGIEVFSHGDHRMAMGLALLGLFSKEGVVIRDADVVAKSFPDFYTILKTLTF